LTYSETIEGVLLWRHDVDKENISTTELSTSVRTRQPWAWTHLRIPNNVQERDDVRPTGQVLQDLDLPLDLLLLDGFEHLDDTFGRGWEVDGFEDLTVTKSEYVER
jgi:hypothetical protein